MQILTLRSVMGVAFGASPTALEPFGPAQKNGRSPSGYEEFEYPGIIFRFAVDGLVEASFEVDAPIDIDGTKVAAADLHAFLRASGPRYFEYVGFAVAPQLGLGYDLSGSNYATASREGRWDSLEAKAKTAAPFRWKPAFTSTVVLGPPCPNCGQPLRTPKAKICFKCGWNGRTQNA